MKLPRIMLTAPASGSGKTLVTCGILQAFVNRHINTASFKCGPDYIDPMFHSRVIGTRSKNLDPFFTDEAVTGYLFGKLAEHAELSVIEGVMGFYDGLGGSSVKASSYDLARILKTPVILVVNCKGMSLSVLAVIKGFLEYRKDSNIKGVLLNQVSPVLYEGLKEQIETQLLVAVVGYLPDLKELVIESRHLGLVMPGEIEELQDKLHRLAGVMEETVDLDRLIEIAGAAPELACDSFKNPLTERRLAAVPGHLPPQIGVAEDEAFCFLYRDNLEALEELGAELVKFSPLHDKELPPKLDGILLSGGYPELYAEALSSNRSMCKSIEKAVKGGMPCIAECGGFLYLHEELEALDGKSYPMAGVIQAKAFKTQRLSRFGYITLTACRENYLIPEGECVRGHEFHYWDSTNGGAAFLAEKPLRNKKWNCMHCDYRMIAGFPHLYYYSNLKVPEAFIRQCVEYHTERTENIKSGQESSYDVERI